MDQNLRDDPKVNSNVAIPLHDGRTAGQKRPLPAEAAQVILTHHVIDPVYIKDDDGSLRQVTEVFVPQESAVNPAAAAVESHVQHPQEQCNVADEIIELVPTPDDCDEPVAKRPRIDESEQTMDIIKQLGNSKRHEFLAKSGKCFSRFLVKFNDT